MGPAPGLPWQPPQHDKYATTPQANRDSGADCRWQRNNEQVIPECRHDYRCGKCGAQGLEHALTMTNRRGEHPSPFPPQIIAPIHEVHNRPPQKRTTRLSERVGFPFTVLNQTSLDQTQRWQPVPFGSQLRQQRPCSTCNQATSLLQSPALLHNVLDQGHSHAGGDRCERPYRGNPSQYLHSEFSQDDSERFPLECFYCPCRQCNCGCYNANSDKPDFRPSPPNHPPSAGDQMNSMNAQRSPPRCRYFRCVLGCRCACHFGRDRRLPRPLRRKKYLTPALCYPYYKADVDAPNNHLQVGPVSHDPAQSTEPSVRVSPSVSPTSEGSGWFKNHTYSDREGISSPAAHTRERFMADSYKRVDKSTQRDASWISETRDGIEQRRAIEKGKAWPDSMEGLQGAKFVDRWDSGVGRWVWEQGLVGKRLEDWLFGTSNVESGVEAVNAPDRITDIKDEISNLDLEDINQGQEVVPAPAELPATEPEEDHRETDSFTRLMDELINTAKEIRKLARRERHLGFIYHKILGTGAEASPEGISCDWEDSNPIPEEYQDREVKGIRETAVEMQARVEDVED